MQKGVWLILCLLFLVACQSEGQAYFYAKEDSCSASSSKGVLYLSSFLEKECSQITPEDKEFIKDVWCDTSSVAFWNDVGIESVEPCSDACIAISVSPFISGSNKNSQKEYVVSVLNNEGCSEEELTITPKVSNSWQASPASKGVLLPPGSWEQVKFTISPPKDLEPGKYPLLFNTQAGTGVAYYVVGSSSNALVNASITRHENTTILDLPVNEDEFSVGYAIYRDGVLVGVIRETQFIDYVASREYEVQTLPAKNFAIN